MDVPLRFIMFLVVGLVSALIIGFAIKGLIETQLTPKIDEETQSSFDELVRVIKQIESGEVESKPVSVKIKSSLLIVGFSEGSSFLRDIITPCRDESCLCICTGKPYNENSCLKYKKSCVKFDSISKLKSNSKSIFDHNGKGFEISVCVSPCSFTVSGDKNSIEITDKE